MKTPDTTPTGSRMPYFVAVLREVHVDPSSEDVERTRAMLRAVANAALVGGLKRRGDDMTPAGWSAVAGAYEFPDWMESEGEGLAWNPGQLRMAWRNWLERLKEWDREDNRDSSWSKGSLPDPLKGVPAILISKEDREAEWAKVLKLEEERRRRWSEGIEDGIVRHLKEYPSGSRVPYTHIAILACIAHGHLDGSHPHSPWL